MQYIIHRSVLRKYIYYLLMLVGCRQDKIMIAPPERWYVIYIMADIGPIIYSILLDAISCITITSSIQICNYTSHPQFHAHIYVYSAVVLYQQRGTINRCPTTTTSQWYPWGGIRNYSKLNWRLKIRIPFHSGYLHWIFVCLILQSFGQAGQQCIIWSSVYRYQTHTQVSNSCPLRCTQVFNKTLCNCL